MSLLSRQEASLAGGRPAWGARARIGAEVRLVPYITMAPNRPRNPRAGPTASCFVGNSCRERMTRIFRPES